jgi:hypothetical protein
MSEDKKSDWVQQIRNNLEEYETSDLLDIWKANNRKNWSPEAFEAIHEILLARLGSVPDQKVLPSSQDSIPKKGEQNYSLTHFGGEVEFSYLSPEGGHQILSRLRSALIREEAANVEQSTDRVVFQVNFIRFVSNWNVLEGVDKGEIILQAGAPALLTYNFSIKRFIKSFSIVTIGCLLILLTTLQSPKNMIPIIFGLLAYGLNYFIIAFRLQSFIWKAITQEE